MAVADRFWAKADKSGECWLWTASRTKKGYGQFKAEHMVYAHRFAYELLVGPIPDGLTIDHLCRVRHCVNPDHMEPVSNRVNVLRGDAVSALNVQKTHCPQGHPYDEANTRLYRGSRYCRTCKRASNRTRRYRATKSAAR